MTGIEEHNYPLFAEVEADLEACKLKSDKIINPARNFGGDRTRDRAEYMKLDILHVLKADVIVLLPGWEKSEGAKLEVAVGQECDKRFERAMKDTSGAWLYHPIDAPSEYPDSPRAQSLQRAIGYVCGDRNASYGPPTQDFRRTADLWTAFGFRFVGHDGAEPQPIVAHQIANAMILLKQSRLAWQPEKADSWDDTSGYSACGYECAVEEAK
jgi:hypothetical protein